jgi:hypothetical protein
MLEPPVKERPPLTIDALKADIERRALERQARLERGEFEVPIHYLPMPVTTLFDLVRQLDYRWDFLKLAVPPAYPSLLGRLKALAKKLVRRASRWVLMRQVEFNHAALFYAAESARQLALTDKNLGELCAAFNALKLRLHALTQRVTELEAERAANRPEHESFNASARGRLRHGGRRHNGSADGQSGAVGLDLAVEEDLDPGPPAELDRSAGYLAYAEYFRHRGEVLDLACGHGDFVQLLLAEGVRVKGIEADADLAAGCQERELPVEHGDGLRYLAGQPDSRLGGIYLSHGAAPLSPRQLADALALGWRKLRKNGYLIVEAPNPACRAAAYGREAGLPVELLTYLFESQCFTVVDFVFSGPVRPGAASVARSSAGDAYDLRDYRYYAVVGRK